MLSIERPRQARKRLLQVVILAASALALTTSSVRAADPVLSWSEPRPVDAGGAIFDIDCPTLSLCIAVDQSGNVVTTGTPEGAADGWTVANIASRSLVGVSCMTAATCVSVSNGECVPGLVCPAVEEPGLLFTSTSPRGGSEAWMGIEVPGAGYLTAIDCADGLCAALDVDRQILTSSDPAGGTGAWDVAAIPGTSLQLRDISCPSNDLCIAVGSEKHDTGGGFFVRENVVLTATNPTAGAGAWTKTYLGFNTYLSAVSCASRSFCVAVDESGEAWSSVDPTGGPVAWSSQLIAPSVPGGILVDISCPSTDLCVALDEGGMTFTSKSPTGNSESWFAEPVGEYFDVSCASASLCLSAGFDSVVVGSPFAPADESGGSAGSPSPGGGVSGVPSSLWLPPSRWLRVHAGKFVKLLLTCLGPAPCTGTATLSLSKKGSRFVRLAAGPIRLRAETRRGVALRLNQAGRDIFNGGRRRVPATLRIMGTVAGEAFRISRPILLRGPKS